MTASGFKVIRYALLSAALVSCLAACDTEAESDADSPYCAALQNKICRLWEVQCCQLDCDLYRCFDELDSSLPCVGRFSQTNYDTCMAQLNQVSCVAGYEPLPNSCRNVYSTTYTPGGTDL